MQPGLTEAQSGGPRLALLAAVSLLTWLAETSQGLSCGLMRFLLKGGCGSRASLGPLHTSPAAAGRMLPEGG